MEILYKKVSQGRKRSLSNLKLKKIPKINQSITIILSHKWGRNFQIYSILTNLQKKNKKEDKVGHQPRMSQFHGEQIKGMLQLTMTSLLSKTKILNS
jgi:hypothetical protein